MHSSRLALRFLPSLKKGIALWVTVIDGLDEYWLEAEALSASLDGIALGIPDAQNFIAFNESVPGSVTFLKQPGQFTEVGRNLSFKKVQRFQRAPGATLI